MRPSYRLVYILGAGHCGSTLLDMLLAGHPQIMALGEVSGIHRFWAMARGRVPVRQSRPESDWVEVSSHPFEQDLWRQVVACVEASGQQFDRLSLRHPTWWRAGRWSDDDVMRFARPNRIVFDCCHRASERPILTDASKRPVRLSLLARSGLFELAVIHLVRDGRGIMYSYLRKYRRWSVAFLRWAGPTLSTFYLHRQLRGVPWLEVRYEALATDPGTTLERICRFLGITYDPQMLRFRAHEYAGLGGNRMRDQGDDQIVFDDQWKRSWRGPGRLAFGLAGGWLNRLCGY